MFFFQLLICLLVYDKFHCNSETIYNNCHNSQAKLCQGIGIKNECIRSDDCTGLATIDVIQKSKVAEEIHVRIYGLLSRINYKSLLYKIAEKDSPWKKFVFTCLFKEVNSPTGLWSTQVGKGDDRIKSCHWKLHNQQNSWPAFGNLSIDLIRETVLTALFDGHQKPTPTTFEDLLPIYKYRYLYGNCKTEDIKAGDKYCFGNSKGCVEEANCDILLIVESSVDVTRGLGFYMHAVPSNIEWMAVQFKLNSDQPRPAVKCDRADVHEGVVDRFERFRLSAGVKHEKFINFKQSKQYIAESRCYWHQPLNELDDLRFYDFSRHAYQFVLSWKTGSAVSSANSEVISLPSFSSSVDYADCSLDAKCLGLNQRQTTAGGCVSTFNCKVLVKIKQSRDRVVFSLTGWIKQDTLLVLKLESNRFENSLVYTCDGQVKLYLKDGQKSTFKTAWSNKTVLKDNKLTCEWVQSSTQIITLAKLKLINSTEDGLFHFKVYLAYGQSLAILEHAISDETIQLQVLSEYRTKNEEPDRDHQPTFLAIVMVGLVALVSMTVTLAGFVVFKQKNKETVIGPDPSVIQNRAKAKHQAKHDFGRLQKLSEPLQIDVKDIEETSPFEPTGKSLRAAIPLKTL